MKLGIMQPYLLPYLGYFDLINYSDRWVVFDTAQYMYHGWINRNRILHPMQGWQYIIIPIKKHHRETVIMDIEISDNSIWQKRIIGQIQHYKKKAPYFLEIHQLIDECLSTQETLLSRINVAILVKLCRYLRIEFKYEYFSEMDLNLGPIGSPGDWALRICEAIGAKEYVNPSGGEVLFNRSQFEDIGIKLTIRNLQKFEYNCENYKFIPGLSIIDVLMWNTPEKVKAYLDFHK